MDSLDIKSVNDSTSLRFTVTSRPQEELEHVDRITCFLVEVVDSQFTGGVDSSTYLSKPPSDFFIEMSEKWKGWEGEKVWSDLEGKIHLKATSNSVGNIFIRIEMRGGFASENSLNTTLQLEAGRLEEIANKMRFLFSMESARETVL